MTPISVSLSSFDPSLVFQNQLSKCILANSTCMSYKKHNLNVSKIPSFPSQSFFTSCVLMLPTTKSLKTEMLVIFDFCFLVVAIETCPSDPLQGT